MPELVRPKENCVSSNGFENFRLFFFILLEKNILLCILKCILPFKMHKIIFFPRKPENFF